MGKNENELYGIPRKGKKWDFSWMNGKEWQEVGWIEENGRIWKPIIYPQKNQAYIGIIQIGFVLVEKTNLIFQYELLWQNDQTHDN